MAKFEYQIATRLAGGRAVKKETRTGHRIGEWFAACRGQHRSPIWTLTHLPTGRACGTFDRLAQCRKMAELLVADGRDWSPKTLKALRKYNAVGRAALSVVHSLSCRGKI